MLAQETSGPEQKGPILLSCTKCAHARICVIFRAVSPLLEQWEDLKPFDPENLANICNEFTSAELVRMAKGGT